LGQWRRCPDVCKKAEIAEPATSIASAFGGLVYIDVPQDCELGKISVKIEGAVKTPYYILGKTDMKKWREEIRNYQGPWAEFETSKVILSVPSEAIRKLEDPQDLMIFWDKMLDACSTLVGRPLKRDYPERYVADEQIIAGVMHSGYPIMTHLDVVHQTVDKIKMLKKGWGYFHEMGHNHQSPDWTFDGSVEVTVNLFSLYVVETVCGDVSEPIELILPETRKKRMEEYFADGPAFDKWKMSPWVGLEMYMQMKEAFGWESFKKVFAEYRDLADEDRPTTEQEKRDQWLVRYSRTVGKNLAPFFEAWALTTTESARASIADMPVWMPEGFPPKVSKCENAKQSAQSN